MKVTIQEPECTIPKEVTAYVLFERRRYTRMMIRTLCELMAKHGINKAAAFAELSIIIAAEMDRLNAIE